MKETPSDLLIVTALQREFDLAAKAARQASAMPRRVDAGLDFTFVNGYRFALRKIGVGADAVKAWWSANVPIGVRPARSLLVVGYAGGLDPKLTVGALLTFDRVVDANSGRFFPLAPVLSAGPPRGLVHASGIVATAAAKRSLGDRTGAAAVDMETLPLAELCASSDIPISALRVLSDSADDNVDLELFRLVDAAGRFRWGRLCRLLGAKPWKIPALIRMGHKIKNADQMLVAGLTTHLLGVSAHKPP